MLAELALLATTRTSPALRRIGLVADGVRLWSRRRRCLREWQAHEAHCHGVVLKALEGLPRRRKVVVLGSGLVRDVPVEALAAAFREVVLVDAVHLPVTRWRLRHVPGLRFVTADIAGIADWLVGSAKTRADALAAWRDDREVDLVISANLLSQLPIGPESWAEDHPDQSLVPPATLARALVGWHIDDLARFTARVCLLTDTEQREYDAGGTLIDRTDLLRGHELPAPDTAWDWTIAPDGEAGRGVTLVHAARGYADFGHALGA